MQTIKKHSLTAMMLLIIALTAFRLTHPTTFSLYPGTDRAVIDIARHSNLKGYADNLERKMIKYYLREGLR